MNKLNSRELDILSSILDGTLVEASTLDILDYNKQPATELVDNLTNAGYIQLKNGAYIGEHIVIGLTHQVKRILRENK